jgi:hypothetical protein
MLNSLFLVVLGVAISLPAISAPLPAKGVKTIRLDDKAVATILVNKNGTVINFPTKPKKVVLGRKDAFDIEYIEDDVAVAALSANASSNLFVYLNGRRYAFRLSVVPQGGDEIILVRDALDNRMKAEVQ